MRELLFDQIESPVGSLLLVVAEGKLCLLEFDSDAERAQQVLCKRYGEIDLRPMADPCGYGSRLRAYFAGDLRGIDEIPVETGGTSFQQGVWLALRTIVAGTVSTYGQLAAQLGNPNAARAVGITNSLNPIAIVLPCHRVIGTNGALTGYAGGLARKRWLLEHEGLNLNPKVRQRASASLVQASLFG